MPLHSGAMGDLNLVAWLQARLAAHDRTEHHDSQPQGVTLASLLDESIHKLQYSTRSTLLQMMLTAHDYLMVQGRLYTPINEETSAVILHAIEGLLLNSELDANIDTLLELMPKELHREYRQKLQSEASALAEEYTEYSVPLTSSGDSAMARTEHSSDKEELSLQATEMSDEALELSASQPFISTAEEPQLLWPIEESSAAMSEWPLADEGMNESASTCVSANSDNSATTVEDIALSNSPPQLTWPEEDPVAGDSAWPLSASETSEPIATADSSTIVLEPLSAPSVTLIETPFSWPQETSNAEDDEPVHPADEWPSSELASNIGNDELDSAAPVDALIGTAEPQHTSYPDETSLQVDTWQHSMTDQLPVTAEEWTPAEDDDEAAANNPPDFWHQSPHLTTESNAFDLPTTEPLSTPPKMTAVDAATTTTEAGITLIASQLDAMPPLLLVIDMAVEDLAALDQESDVAPEAIVQRAADHLENIAFAAESCSFDPFASHLRKRAEALLQSVNGAPASLNALLRGTLEFLSGARQQALSLLEIQPSAPVVPPPTVELPAEDQTPMAQNSAQAFPTEEEMPTTASEEITYSDERLAVLAEELAEIEPELAALAITLVKAEDTALLEPLARYGDLMSRLATVCDALGMEGLKRVVTTIADNANLLPSLERSARPSSSQLFLGWPAAIERYLRDPSDGPAADALIDLLQAKEWPAPLSGIDSRDLFTLLIAGPTAEEENHEPTHRPSKVSIEDVSLAFDPDVNRDLFESFLIEAPDIAAQFNAIITHLGDGGDILDDLRKAQRMSHTLKGSANLIGIKGIASLAHHTEDILDTLARTRTTPPLPLRDALARSGDCLEGMIDAVHGLDTPPEDSLEVLQLILDWAHLVDRGEYDKLPVTAGPAVAPAPAAKENETAPGTGATSDALSSVRVSSTTIDDMFRLVEEITISQGQIREQVSRLKKLGDSLAGHEQILQSKRFNLENLVDIRSIANMQRKAHRQRIARDEFDPLEMDQYDELHAATHSYIEAVADARELNQFVVNNVSKLDSLLLRQDRLNKELQQLVGATRLVPVAVIASRLERAVRQACRVTQKQATLEIIGRQFLIDGEVLNKLVDPLLHMLRNAVDHGIEAPDERLEMGKQPQGTITLEFRQEGNNVVVTCRDDGRGLDYDRIAEVAQQKGLAQHAQQLSREQLGQLILSPAFTTRSSATQLSGRGIGLDAVQATVTALKGNITIGDNERGGTEFTIHLPTSLVTSHSLIVRSGNERFAIPTSYLQQILPPGSGRITLYGDTETFQLGSAFYPLRTLNSLLSLPDETPKESKTVLITSAGSRGGTAVAVDYVLQSAELVVKGLGKYVRNAAGSIGVSVLGDGQVIPVLDLPQLISGERSNQMGNVIDGQLSLATLDEGIKRPPQVLIVDDSLSVRNTLSQLLNDVGYRTQAARDGVEALELIRKKAPAIVLTDLEMPRMDGMELTRSLRDNPSTELLPIVMITSRTQAKHRSAAEQAGINAYVTKPFMEEELLDTIGSLLENHAHA